VETLVPSFLNPGSRPYEAKKKSAKADERPRVNFLCNTRVTGFQFKNNKNNNKDETSMTMTTDSSSVITKIEIINKDRVKSTLNVDDVILAVGAKSLNAFV